MEPNPYESPRRGEAVQERRVMPGDPLLAVLTEIRDAQVEMLEQQRQALAMQRDLANRTKIFRPYTVLMMLLPLAIMAFPLYRLWTLKPPTSPVPVRRAGPPAPFPTPATAPVTGPVAS